MQIESRVMLKAFEFLREAGTPGELESAFGEILGELGMSDHEAMIQEAKAFFGKLGSRDCSLFELWRDTGWKGLKKDEPFVASCLLKAAPALLEIQDEPNGMEMRCLDLLRPERGPFTVVDRSLAASLSRFQVIFTWCAPYPHFVRCTGGATQVAEGNGSPRDLAFEVMRQLGAPEPGTEEQIQWLKTHMGELDEEITNRSLKAMSTTLRDSDLRDCTAVYRFMGAKRELPLAGREDFEEEELSEGEDEEDCRSFVWLRTGPSKAWEDELPEVMRGASFGTRIWGSLRWYADRVEVQTVGEVRFRPMLSMMEAFFGEILYFEGEKMVDLGKQHALRLEDGEPAFETDERREDGNIEPPGELFKAAIAKHYEGFADVAVPALGNLTPREVSQRPEMRQQLTDFLKGHIRSVDELCAQHGFSFDLNSIVDELGFPELRVPEKIIPFQTVQIEGAWWRQIDCDEIMNALDRFETLLDGERFEEEQGEVWTGFCEFDETLFNSEEVEILLDGAAIVYNLCVPPGVSPSMISLREYRGAVEAVFSQVLDVNDADEEASALEWMDEFMDSSVQPEVMELCSRFFFGFEQLARESGKRRSNRVRPESFMPMMVHFEALMRCLRERGLGLA